MQLAAINREQADTIVTVLGAVATARGTQEASDADLAVIRAAATHLLGGATVPDDLAGSIPGVVVEQLAHPDARDLTLTAASVLCFTATADDETGEPAQLEPSRVTVVDDLARYLRMSALSVVELRRLTKQQRDGVADDIARRLPAGTADADAPMVNRALVQSESRLHIDARRVHALWERVEQLPTGTVGAELVRYYAENGWSYPGTDHHQSLTFAEHDFHHVLGGYATTPAGELQVSAFTAGVAGRPVDAARGLLVWEQLGAGSPAGAGAADAFAPEPFFAALERGTRTTCDFVGPDWDPWAIVERDLAALRAEYQVDDSGQLAPGERYDRDPVAADR